MLPQAITGYGVVSAVGIGREAFEAALQSGMPLCDRVPAPIVTFDTAKYERGSLEGGEHQPRYGNASTLVTEVPDFDPTKYLGDKGLRTLDRLTKLMVVATRMALHDSGLKVDGKHVATSAERVGVISSNAYGSLETITELDRVAILEDARYINPAKFPNTVSNSASGYVSIWEDLRALNVAVSDGNCGGLDTFAAADLYLESDRADAFLVGGAEAMSEALFLAFQRLEFIAKGARLAEAAAFFAFERHDHAMARGARILAETVGFGTAFRPPPNEHSLVHASPEALGQAVVMALDDANLTPEQIDVVAASHAGIPRFDREEAKALASVLPDSVPIAGPKVLFGETLGAGGSMGVAAALAWFGGITPSPILRGPVPRKPLRHVLVTSLGFYGNASALILRAPTS